MSAGSPAGGHKVGVQPVGRYSAINSRHLMTTNQDTFVSAQESSKLHCTKCLFFAVRNTSPHQTDKGMSRVIIPAKSALEQLVQGCQLGRQSSMVQPLRDGAGNSKAGFSVDKEENR